MANESEEVNNPFSSSPENSQNQEKTGEQLTSPPTTSSNNIEEPTSGDGANEGSTNSSSTSAQDNIDNESEDQYLPFSELDVQEKIVSSIPQAQEKTRAVLAKSLILLFAGTVAASFLYIFLSIFIPKPINCLPSGFQNPIVANPSPSPTRSPNPTNSPSSTSSSNVTFCSFDNSSKELITLILNSLTAILGTALGFYFGTQAKDDKN